MLPYLGDWAAELAAVWSSDPPDVVHALGWLGAWPPSWRRNVKACQRCRASMA
ncbi:group 1 glycosyl transferase domain protein [Mycobacterium kansasii]|uniref:Group 1 glycosyl transferase domain protein n=1 Tax=Mycobacterium kansasii TaxID=1768 RepID=A0A1V3X972_MYCKA|nr:group 1 glycosyl transferase domain protein [Mycobacterium kansasii]